MMIHHVESTNAMQSVEGKARLSNVMILLEKGFSMMHDDEFTMEFAQYTTSSCLLAGTKEKANTW
jgi:hypothetical protein